MGRKKISLDQFAAEIGNMLDEYGDDIDEGVKKVTHQLALAGVRELKSASKSTFGGTGKYAAGWRTHSETERFAQHETLHNAAVPGLPHLLEHGHAKRNGGRVPGRVHIKPIEDKLVDTAVKEIESRITS